MKQDSDSMALVPFNFAQILEEVPELKKFNLSIDAYSFDPAIDSSDVRPEVWVELAELIKENYSRYDGFVVLHGTDTMAFTSSMLSFMLENLEKPVILTGSQLPIGVLRTDGRENLISSIEIAAAERPDGRPYVPEVCVFFDNELYRGNRTYKYSAEYFNAFKSPNCRHPHQLQRVGNPPSCRMGPSAFHQHKTGHSRRDIEALPRHVAAVCRHRYVDEGYESPCHRDLRLRQRPRPSVAAGTHPQGRGSGHNRGQCDPVRRRQRRYGRIRHRHNPQENRSDERL